MNEYTCKFCESKFERRGKKKAVFCSINCKAEWQKTQKPVTKEWLRQKYIVEELGTYEISKLVNRDPKRVYEWLIGYEIPTRSKHDSIVMMNQRSETIEKRRESSTGRTYTKETRNKIAKARSVPSPHLAGKNNGMYGKTGELSPNWKGGVTPLRQSVYSSKEWSLAVTAVWKRDNATCQRCGKKKTRNALFHIHHISPFADVPELRTSPDNLVLLCAPCHYFTHSKENTNKEFIK